MNRSGFDIREALENSTSKGVRAAVNLPVEQVMPNRFQPRVLFRNIDELADSIKQDGQLEPIAVRVLEDGSGESFSFKYEIIYGGRRYAACVKNGGGFVNALVYGPGEVSDERMEIWANIENTQREELRFLEALRSFKSLFERLGSAKAVSEKTRKTVVTVQYYLNVAKAFDCHEEFKRLLKDTLGSSKRADAFTYTVGGKFADIAHHIASLDPGVSLKGEVLKKNRREFKRFIERFDRDGLAESMNWAVEKVERAVRSAQNAKGVVSAKEAISVPVFSENDKELVLSVRVRKGSGVDAAFASAVRKGIDSFLSRMDLLVVGGGGGE